MTSRPPQWILFVVTIVGITLITPIAPVIPDIVRAFGEDKSAAGLILGASTMPGIFLAPVIGVLADRHGRRRILVPCLVLFAAAGTASIFAPTLGWLISLRFVQGIGAAGLINLVVVIIGDHWDGTERVRMIGRNSAALTAGLASIPTVGGLLADVFGWRGPFYLYPIVFAVSLLALKYLPPDQPHDAHDLGEQMRLSWKVLKTPTVSGIILLEIGMMVAIFGLILTVLPFHLEAAYGLSASARGLFLGVPSLVSFWVALNAGRIAERFGRGRAVALGIVLFAVSYSVLATSWPIALYIGGAAIWGLAEGLTFPPMQDLVVGAADDRSRGTVIAVSVSAIRLGQSVGPVMGGIGLAAIGATSSFMVGAIFLGLLAVVAELGRRRLALR